MMEQLNVLDSPGLCEHKANSYDQIKKFFNENKSIKPYFMECLDEHLKNNCQSMSTIMIATIEKLLDKIDKLSYEKEGVI